jgi:ATP-dependent DNA helicase RecQ
VRPTSLADHVRETAAREFGWSQLRPGQLDAVLAVVDGRDVLAVMPTGAGKSAVYQIAALLIDGPTVVVSPLIALQRDQIASLARTDAPPAVAVNSAQSDADIDEAWDVLRAGRAEFVFLAPEQLAKESVMARLRHLQPSLFVVDEAHCVSSWGHDFRPDYLRLADALDRLGRPRVVALTATAAPPVRDEIVDRLRLREPFLVVRGFDRPNISLEVARFVDDRDKRMALVDRVASLPPPGLVYTATRRNTTEYAAALAERGLRAVAYHAGLPAAERHDVHERFRDGEVDTVVATSAFGMGIDKADLRYVVHADVPDSVDSYYQEIGRAGRDGADAVAVLLYRPEDLGLRRFFASRAPDPETIDRIVAAIGTCSASSISALCRATGLARARVLRVVNLLEMAGAVRMSRRGVAWGHLDADGVVDRVLALSEAWERIEQSRIEMMRAYAETSGCRRQLLLGYFGEQLANPCRRCDRCAENAHRRATTGVESESDHEFPVNARVEHAEWGPGIVMMHSEADRVTVLFEQVGYRTLALSVVRDEKLLRLTPGAAPPEASPASRSA